jgi:hypothetical protein
MDLRQELSPLVLKALIAVLTSARDSVVTDDTQPAFARYVAELLAPVVTALGEPASAESVWRHEARMTVMAGLLDLAGAVTAAALAERWTASWLESASRLELDDALLVLRISARSAGVVTPELIRRRLSQQKGFAESFPLVAALGAPVDSNELLRTLDDYLEGRLDAHTLPWLSYGAARQLHTRKTIADWALKNFPALVRRVPRHESLVELVGFSCDDDELAEWRKLWTEHLGRSAALVQFEKQLVASRDCALFRQQKSQNFAEWLARRR